MTSCWIPPWGVPSEPESGGRSQLRVGSQRLTFHYRVMSSAFNYVSSPKPRLDGNNYSSVAPVSPHSTD